MSLTRQQLGHDFRNAGNRVDNQRNAEFVSKGLHKIEFRPGRTVGTFGIGGRAVACNNAEFARLEHLIQ